MNITNFRKEVSGQSGDFITEYSFNYKSLLFTLQCFSDNDYNLSAIDKKNNTFIVIDKEENEIQFIQNDKHDNVKFDCCLQITRKNTFSMTYLDNTSDMGMKVENLYIDNNDIYYKKKGLRKFAQTMKTGYLLLNDSNILLYQLLTDENLKEDKHLNRLIKTLKNFEQSEYKKVFEEIKTITPEKIRDRKPLLDYMVTAMHQISDSIYEHKNNKKPKLS